MRILLVPLLLLLSSCGDVDKGDLVQALVQKDGYNACRIIVRTSNPPLKTFSAIIEGCKER